MSVGPKCYAFIVCDANGQEHEICKFKGITLNYKNSQQVNFKTLCNFVLRNNNESQATDFTKPIISTNDVIRATKLHDLLTRKETKTCALKNVKRWSLENSYSTYPFGYVED